MTTTPNPAERLAWLLKLLGPQGVAELTRPLTDDELQLVEAGLARHNGDPVAAAGVNVPDDVAAEMRRVMAVTQ